MAAGSIAAAGAASLRTGAAGRRGRGTCRQWDGDALNPLAEAASGRGFQAPLRFNAADRRLRGRRPDSRPTSTAPSTASAASGTTRRCSPTTRRSTPTATSACSASGTAGSISRAAGSRPNASSGCARPAASFTAITAIPSPTIRRARSGASQPAHRRQHRAARSRRQAVRAQGRRAAAPDRSEHAGDASGRGISTAGGRARRSPPIPSSIRSRGEMIAYGYEADGLASDDLWIYTHRTATAR